MTASCGRGGFGREYEYDEEIFLDLDGSATVVVNGSLYAFVALHGLPVNPDPGVRFDRAAYRERNVVERTINRLKQHRAIATRYEKLEVAYHALLTIAAILLWLPV